MKRKPLKIDERLLKKLRARKKRTGQEIAWQAERAIKKDLEQDNKK